MRCALSCSSSMVIAMIGADTLAAMQQCSPSPRTGIDSADGQGLANYSRQAADELRGQPDALCYSVLATPAACEGGPETTRLEQHSIQTVLD
jgi:hypothetical protein